MKRYMCMHQVEEMAKRTAAGLPQVSKPADKKAASTPAWNIHSASTKVTLNCLMSHPLCLSIAQIHISGLYQCGHLRRDLSGVRVVCSAGMVHECSVRDILLYPAGVWKREQGAGRGSGIPEV